MPIARGGRPLKRWRYIGAYGPEVMVCAGDARIGPLRQRFWAAALPDGRVVEKTAILGSGGLRIDGSRATVDSRELRAVLRAEEDEGVETLSAHGGSYIWTRKQAGIPVRGHAELFGQRFEIDGEGMIDDSAGYHARHTVWSWSAGVGRAADGRRVAWNLVTGVHDAPEASERSIWLDGEPFEPGPVEFAADLSEIRFAEGGSMRFTEWAAREDDTNVLLLRSWYRQPFGTFEGELPGGVRLERGYGVMEAHDVRW
jgi:hypothetical protein